MKPYHAFLESAKGFGESGREGRGLGTVGGKGEGLGRMRADGEGEGMAEGGKGKSSGKRIGREGEGLGESKL